MARKREPKRESSQSAGRELHHKSFARLPLIALVTVALLSATAAAQLPSRPEEWRSLYQELAPDHPLAARAHSVFERLVRAADVRGRALPSLLILEGLTYPEALALPGGSIVLSLEMLEYCLGRRGEFERHRGDARLALVLGHELAHLTFDNGHRAYYSARELGSRATAKVLSGAESDVHLRMEEREAEYYGLHFLLRAGFAPQSLSSEGADFWRGITQAARRAGLEASRRHIPRPEERAELLHTQLAGLEQAEPLLQWGRRFTQLGKSEMALRLLEEYKLLYAGPQVLEAIGVAHLQLATGELAACGRGLPHGFELPVLASQRSVALRDAALRTESTPACFRPGAFRRQLNQARRALERAAKMQTDHSSALVHLAYSYLLEGDITSAWGPASQARERAPQDPLAVLTWAVVWFLLGAEHGIDHSLEPLEALSHLGEQGFVERAWAQTNALRIGEMLGERGPVAALFASSPSDRGGDGESMVPAPWQALEELSGVQVGAAGELPEACLVLESPASVGLPEPPLAEGWKRLTERRLGSGFYGFFASGTGRAIARGERTLAFEWTVDEHTARLVMQRCRPAQVAMAGPGRALLVFAGSALEVHEDGPARGLVWSASALGEANEEQCGSP